MNKLLGQYSNDYHHSINKKPSNADYSALTEKIETNSKAPKFTVNDRVRITKCKNIFSKGYIENWYLFIYYIKYILSILFSKLILGLKMKYLNGEKILGSFYVKKKSILLSKL